MTATYAGFGVRQRNLAPARHAPSPLPDRFRQNLENANRAIAEPIKGITTDGSIRPGLFPIETTGVSTAAIREAADAFLASLDGERRAAASFAIDSDAWRRWNNTHPFLMRHGVLLEELTDAQRERALDILRATLSTRGFQTSRDIMRLNYTIGEITGSWEEYGEWVYWLSIFGTPSDTEPWGWQIDGHHLILNCFVLGDQVVMTPAFMGSEPVYADFGKFAGTRVLQEQEQKGLEVVRSLDATQRAKAVREPAGEGNPRGFDGHIQAGAYRDNLVLPYEGLRCDTLTAGQQELLLGLAELYVGCLNQGHAGVRMSEVAKHLDETHLLWVGGIGDEDVFYYRLHSPVILIEFDHQRGVALDNDVPSKLHIHTIVRTPNGGDYGADLLRQHYERHHR